MSVYRHKLGQVIGLNYYVIPSTWVCMIFYESDIKKVSNSCQSSQSDFICFTHKTVENGSISVTIK